MPFIDVKRENALNSGLEGLADGEAEDSTHVGVDYKKSHLIAVAILSNMEKQGRTLAVVTRPYAYQHPILSDDRLTIPEGFVTDFASIPRMLHVVVQPFGRHAPAAVIHDYLYASGQAGTRRYADYLFYESMRESGVPFIRRSLMYTMVRLFGKSGYGLKGDWTSIDHEFGEEIEPPVERPEIQFMPWREWKAFKKIMKAKNKAA